MYTAPRVCPVCRDELIIRSLRCRSCETTIDGAYRFRGLAQLSAEQLHFVETFIRCEGKLNRMEKKLGASYPTLRSRLKAVIGALGYPVPGEPVPVPPARRVEILEDIARGTLTPEQAVSQLRGSQPAA